MVDIRHPLSCEEAVQCLCSIYKEYRNPVDESVPVVCELAMESYKDVPFSAHEDRTKKEGPYNSRTIPFLQYRLNIACILADNMKTSSELAITALIGPGLSSKRFYRNTLEPRIKTPAYDRISNVLKGIPNTYTDIWAAAEEIDKVLWRTALDQQHDEVSRILRRNGIAQPHYTKPAFELAYAAHSGVFRQTGEPYLSHPLAVAKILAEKGAESELVAAAILHDVIEDSSDEPDQSREKIKEISPRIARYVEAVTSVDREYQKYLEETDSSADMFDKEDLDRATVNKLLAMSREDESMIQAVYIKAADRYHNLLTIDGMPYAKIRNKLDETENYYLPIFRAFGINEFVPAIEDQVWRARDPGYYQQVRSKFESVLSQNQTNLADTYELLRSVAEDRIKEKGKELRVYLTSAVLRKEEILPIQIYQMLREKDPDELLLSIDKQNVPLQCCSIVMEGDKGRDSLGLFVSVLIKSFMDITEDLRGVITRIWSEPVSRVLPEHRRIAFEIENDMASRTVVYVYDQDDYYLYKKGSVEGVETPDKSDDIEMLAGSIRVHRADNTVINLPEGATALDFAFAIHRVIGLNAQKASINGSEPSEQLLYNVLHDGDKVIISHAAGESGESGEKKVKIEWLNHVVTNSAKKRITRYLQDKYEKGDRH